MKLKEFLKKAYNKVIKRVIIVLLIATIVRVLLLFASSNNPQNMVVKTIKFEEANYTCNEGKTITTNVSGEVSNANIFSISNDIVEIKRNDIDIPKCGNCVVIDIICKKVGNTNIEADAVNGNKAVSLVTVNK